MEKKALLPALFVGAASNANEHEYSLRDQLRHHREFLINNNLKSIPRTVYLNVIDSIEHLTGKVLIHPAIEKLSKDLQQKWLKTHQSLTNTIATTTATTLQSRAKTYQLNSPPGNEGAAAASDFRLVIKLSDKGIITWLRGIEPQTILKETNKAIQADKEILEEHLPIVVQGLKQLRSGDFEVHTEKVEHVEILQAATDWVIVFGAITRVQISTYGVLVHLIHPKSLDLGNLSKVAKVANLVYNINRTKLFLFTRPEAITYIGWLKADIIGLKSLSIKMEFDNPDMANEAIRKGLNWDGQLHSVERYVSQSKIMQCFNCQSYGQIRNWCLSTITCAKCEGHYHTKSCTANYRCCTACHGAHPSQSNNCKTRIREKERIKKAIREAPIYWPLKAAPQDSLETPNMDSQTTHHVRPILPNSPSLALPFSSRKPQKSKKKAHKMHHTPDFQQSVEPAQTSHFGFLPIDWEKRFSDKENATRITEIKHNTTIENQEKPIKSLIAWTLLPVSDHPHTPTCKKTHFKAITPDDDLETWDSPRTFLFKRRNLSNDDKSPEPIKRQSWFQRQQAANPNR